MYCIFWIKGSSGEVLGKFQMLFFYNKWNMGKMGRDFWMTSNEREKVDFGRLGSCQEVALFYAWEAPG